METVDEWVGSSFPNELICDVPCLLPNLFLPLPCHMYYLPTTTATTSRRRPTSCCQSVSITVLHMLSQSLYASLFQRLGPSTIVCGGQFPWANRRTGEWGGYIIDLPAQPKQNKTMDPIHHGSISPASMLHGGGMACPNFSTSLTSSS